MSRVEEIKAAIDQLSPEERCELTALLNPVEEDDWERQMKPLSFHSGTRFLMNSRSDGRTSSPIIPLFGDFGFLQI